MAPPKPFWEAWNTSWAYIGDFFGHVLPVFIVCAVVIGTVYLIAMVAERRAKRD